MPDDPLLDIRNLKTYFYTTRGIVKAIDGIDLEIGKNDTVGLVGESGCGKSTVVFSIMRTLPQAGKIVDGQCVFKGKDLLTLDQGEMRKIRGAEISVIFQDPTTYLNPVMKVGNQIGEVISLHQNIRKDGVKKKVAEILQEVRIPACDVVAQSYPFELSGGMQQRILISMALSCKPSLLIADEPTTNLDVTIQAQILELMKELIQVSNYSLLLITHDLGIVADICNRVYVMYAGEIVEHGRFLIV